MQNLILLLSLASLLLPSLAPAADFQLGADISSLPEVEAAGGHFSQDQNGPPRDLLAILKDAGLTDIRLRIWNNPQAGWYNLPHTLALAQRIHAAHLRLLLDFHYSDTWADPAHQYKPAAWKDLHGQPLQDALHHYTAQVLQALKDQNTPPAMVQLGNEITPGLLWPDGQLYGKNADPKKQWSTLASLLSAAARAVRQTCPDTRIMIHLDCGGDNAHCRWFLDNLTQQKVDFDVIGLSYYPRWHGPLDKLKANLADLSSRYKKDVIVVETSYYRDAQGVDPAHLLPAFPPTIRGQKAYLQTLRRTIQESGGQGLYYWEPACLPLPNVKSLHWSNQSLFTPQGHPTDALNAFRPTP